MDDNSLITHEVRLEIKKICDVVTEEMGRSLQLLEIAGKNEREKQGMAERTIATLNECLEAFVWRCVGDGLVKHFEEEVKQLARKKAIAAIDAMLGM